MRLAIGTSLTGAGVAPSDPLIYQSRVVADGGTVADPTNSYIVYNEVTAVDTPTLLCTCDAGKAEVLYNIIPAPTGATYLSEVGGMPTAAYSVDRVVDGYYDYVMEVRRTVSAVTVEADVAFDGDTITLDSAVTITSGTSSATTLGEFVAASGYTDVDSLGSAQDAFVATWYDQAGSNDASQTTAASQPKIVSAGALVTENGKVALDFDGTDDFMEATSLIVTQPSTYFVSYKYNDLSLITYTDIIDGSVSRNLIDLITGNFVRMFAGTSFASTIAGTTQQSLRYNFFNGASSQIAVNGGLAQTGDAGTDRLEGLLIGNTLSNYLDGLLQEIIIYDSDKSALRTAIEGNINGRFSIYT